MTTRTTIPCRRLPALALTICVVASGLFGTRANAQDDRWSLEVVGGWGGTVNAVDVDELNQIAYVGAGQRLVIVDISNMAEPSEIGSINLLETVEDLKVRGGYAFVATIDDPYRFCVVDVRDPAAPELVWFDPGIPAGLEGFWPREVDLFGDVAYVRSGLGFHETLAYDISDPTDPSVAAEVFGRPSRSPSVVLFPNDIHIVGDKMYVAERAAWHPVTRFVVFDLSVDPLFPQVLDSVPVGTHEAQRLAIEGDRAYVTSVFDYRLHIIDVADPRILVLLGSVETGASGMKIGTRNGFVYIPAGTGIIIVDATDPTNPVLEPSFRTRGQPEEVQILGDTAYVLDRGEGLVFLDVSADPVSPTRIGHYHSPGALRRIAKQGDLLFVSDFWNGFSVLDVSNPRRPALVGAYQTPERPLGGPDGGSHGIAVDGSMVYLAIGGHGLEEVDVTNPAEPVMRRAFRDVPFNNTMQALALSRTPLGQLIAHVGLQRLLYEIDVSSMSKIGEAPIASGAPNRSIVLDDQAQTAFLSKSGGFAPLQAVDVTDPTAPEVIYEGEPDPATDVALSGATAYVAIGEVVSGSVRILDVSAPHAPAPVGDIPMGLGFPLALDVQGDRLYVSGMGIPAGQVVGEAGLHIFDVSAPGSPTLLAVTWAGVAGNSVPLQDVFSDEPYVYVAGSDIGDALNTGLVIFESRCSPDCDGSGALDFFDFLCFQNLFAASDPGADCDESGKFDFFDFLCFQNQFAAGCP